MVIFEGFINRDLCFLKAPPSSCILSGSFRLSFSNDWYTIIDVNVLGIHLPLFQTTIILGQLDAIDLPV
jgi:hypothetical protein